MNECKKEKRGGICFYNCDNIEFMKTKPDNYYDLAIVDPPYGIDITKSPRLNKDKGWKDSGWDSSIPDKVYFDELRRVSKNQIVWGWNYFTKFLAPCRGVICWDKMNHTENYSDIELAYCSVDGVAKKFTYMWDGNRYGFPNNIQGVGKKSIRIHPSQKPIDLYRWCLRKYAKEGMNILDTHGGSHTNAIACDIEGFDLDIIEIDTEYFESGVAAFDYHKRQLKLF